MPSGTATVTAKAGPNESVTAQVFSGVSAFTVDIARSVLQLWIGTQPTSGPQKEFDLAAVTTFTAVLSGAGGNWTITVS